MHYVIQEKDSSPPRFLNGYNGRTDWQWTFNPFTAWPFPTLERARYKAEYVNRTSGTSVVFLPRNVAQNLAKKHWNAKSAHDLERILQEHERRVWTSQADQTQPEGT